jgi:hypothetical protein
LLGYADGPDVNLLAHQGAMAELACLMLSCP